MPKQLFRTKPPILLVEQFLKCANLEKGIRDRTWFTKSCISLQTFEELLPELEPYYLPCASKEYIHSPLTSTRAITILRQILLVNSIELRSIEKSMNGVRGFWYQVLCPEEQPFNSEEGIQIVFT